MKKIFTLAALALTLAACNKQDIQPVGQNDGMITLTATLAPKGAATKAISEDGNTLKADWAKNEKLAILYEVGGTKKHTSATVTEVDASGAATIEFTVESGTTDGTPCTVVYPASLVGGDPDFAVSSDAALIGNQPGTLDGRLDVRVTTGRISPVDPSAGLVLDAPLAPKYAIVKFSLKDWYDAITAKSLAVTIGTEAFVATPASATSEFYLALPAVSDGTLIVSALNVENHRFSKDGITIEAGMYYRSTLEMAEQSDSPDYVKMGDGLYWDTKNRGASSPDDYGYYFAWGETSTKTTFTWDNYEWAKDGSANKLTKYCPSGKTDYWGGSGTPDNILELEIGDDPGYIGGNWRTPTRAEWEALLNTSDFTWAWVENFNNTGKNGRLVISRKSGYEGNCIFLPAAGYRNNANLKGTGSVGYYWSSSLSAGRPSAAYILGFDPGDAVCRDDDRFYGQSVRPVQTAE